MFEKEAEEYARNKMGGTQIIKRGHKMTEQEKNFNEWFDEYNIEKIKVFEEPDLKMAYLQGCADEVEKWKKAYNETQSLLDKQIEATYKVVEELNKAKKIIGNLYDICKDNNYPNSSVLMEQAEAFLKEAGE